MEHGVGGSYPFGRTGGELTIVEVPVETREIAAGEFEAQAVARAEDVTRSPKVDRERIHLPGSEESRSDLRVAVACPEYAIG